MNSTGAATVGFAVTGLTTTMAILTNLSTVTSSKTPMPTTTWIGTTCGQRSRDLATVPEWFLTSMLHPYYDLLCSIPEFTNTFDSSSGEVKGQLRVIDQITGLPRDYRDACWKLPSYLWFKFKAQHYRAFYGVQTNYVASWDPVAQIVFVQLVLFTAPFVVLTQCFGLMVIVRLLKDKADAHILVYHRALVVLQVALYIFNAPNINDQIATLLVPFCLASPHIAAGWQGGYAAQIGPLLLDAGFCLATLIQALMTMDRVFAVYTPVEYRARANARTAALGIGVAFAVNTIMTVLELIFSAYHMTALLNQATRTDAYQRMLPAILVILCLRFPLLASGFLAQAIGSGLLLAKIRALKRDRRRATDRLNQKTVSLLPCYMLMGTCSVNLVACVVELITSSTRLFNALRPIEGQLYVARKIAVPVCGSASIFVHLAASSLFRAEAWKILSSFLGPVAKRLRLGKGKCCRRGEQHAAVAPMA